ncbi:MAG: ABC transporter ATP-binding protein [Gammaproteobacteria bacterium]
MNSIAVALRDVSVRFGRADAAYTAIANVDLEIGDGEFVCVVGPTGCGKSTLLNVVAGLAAPATGEVQVFGQSLAGLNRDAGYLFQADALLPWATARDNVAAGLVFGGLARDVARVQADEWLARVGLGAFGDRYPHQLSGGMKKRVALAQTLARDPKILLMDEPFSALDVQTRSLMENELLALWAANRKSVLFVTHDLEEAIALGDRVIVMSAGPGSRPLSALAIDLPRPRDVTEARFAPHFAELQRRLWATLRAEVQKSRQGSPT